ncbi:hypothetical protein [Verminephrobacter eiseniae]|uniref:hypothetical protein n=1 Tax=Verminephrobacter eiseniae TaxID=364317 RepID=UPI00223873F1|nr:hypothetical protein [Verminephrobacter eiseniae]
MPDREAAAAGSGTVPIGRPVANTEYFILRSAMQTVGVGESSIATGRQLSSPLTSTTTAYSRNPALTRWCGKSSGAGSLTTRRFNHFNHFNHF